MTPPAENAGLYKGLKELKELIASYQSLREGGRGPAICATIIETAKQCNLDKDISLPAESEDANNMQVLDRDDIVGKVYSKYAFLFSTWGSNLTPFVCFDLALPKQDKYTSKANQHTNAFSQSPKNFFFGLCSNVEHTIVRFPLQRHEKAVKIRAPN